MVTIFGIKSCDSVKQARVWLEQHQIAYTFHDFRLDGLTEVTLSAWVEQVGWETLLNRRSKSWKELAEHEKEMLDETKAKQLMLSNPTLIKRPVVNTGTQVLVGFSDEEFTTLLDHMKLSAKQGT